MLNRPLCLVTETTHTQVVTFKKRFMEHQPRTYYAPILKHYV